MHAASKPVRRMKVCSRDQALAFSSVSPHTCSSSTDGKFATQTARRTTCADAYIHDRAHVGLSRKQSQLPRSATAHSAFLPGSEERMLATVTIPTASSQ